MIGFLKSGSIGEGFVIRLDRMISPETLRIGDFVVIQGRLYQYFGIIDDLKLMSANEDVFFDPPDNDFKKRAITGPVIFSEAVLSPYIMADSAGNIFSIKTIPEHFSIARRATGTDLETIFKKNAAVPFFVGTPLTMEEKIYVDLKKLCERNSAIFGITGSGKTFLARIIYSGIIKHNVASLLIFDMHNEYGRTAKSGENYVPALKFLFPTKVKVFDVANNPDADSYINIPLKYIEPQDLSLVSSSLHYSEKSEETALLTYRQKGVNWLRYLFSLQRKSEKEIAEEAEKIGANSASLGALVRHLNRLSSLKFIQDINEENSIDQMLNYLKNGISVVVQFSGKYANDPLSYFLVANVISRRIHRKYEKLKEEEREKQRIVIVIEEAHKFLSTNLKDQNIFGTIAREMRKFNVTLSIIDQRPCEIDEEVLSQVGTRFVLQLMDEKDMDAVFQGVGGGKRLKKILRTLQSQETLLFGYSVPMPVAMRVREYEKDFFKEVQEQKEDPLKGINDIYG